MFSDKYGVYPATNEGVCSWYEFACKIFRQAGMGDVKFTPVDSGAFPVRARRSEKAAIFSISTDNADRMT